MTEQERWHELGQQLRVDSVRAAAAAGSGHPTSSMSAADLMAVLLDKYLRYDFGDPENADQRPPRSSPKATPRRCSTRSSRLRARSPTTSC